ncbi:MAG: sulfotransferase [Pirellulales bacterium]|nr:sulfotransferase [Pirellulales bacterium]
MSEVIQRDPEAVPAAGALCTEPPRERPAGAPKHDLGRRRLYQGWVPRWGIWLHGQLMNVGAALPKYRLAGPLQSDPFFILGCGRSGNTLLRAMLCAHGDMVIPPESYTVGRCIKQFLRYGGHPWSVVCDILIGTFEEHREFFTWDLDLRETRAEAKALRGERRSLANVLELIYLAYRDKHFPGAHRWGDKTPFYSLFASRVVEVFPRAKIIHLVRDPRACANSYLQCGMYDRASEAAWHWRRSHEEIARARRRLPPGQSVVVCYEDLVTEPEQVCRELAAFLETPFRAAMLSHSQRGKRLGDVEVRSHHANVMKPLNRDSVAKWKQELSAEDIRIVESICGRLSSRFLSIANNEENDPYFCGN